MMMSDKEYMMDILDTEKHMSVNMTYAMNEASCEYLYKKYFDMFKNINKATKEVFDLAYQKGFYTLEEEEKKKIKSAVKTLSQELDACADCDACEK